MNIKNFAYRLDDAHIYWIGVNLKKEDNKVTVENIQIENADINLIGLKGKITLQEDSDAYYLVNNYTSTVNGENIVISEVVKNIHTQFIVEQILRIIGEAAS